MQNKSYGRSDGKGRRTKVTLWNRAVDDVAGVVARLVFYVSFIPFLVFGFWSLLATKLQKYKNIT